MICAAPCTKYEREEQADLQFTKYEREEQRTKFMANEKNKGQNSWQRNPEEIDGSATESTMQGAAQFNHRTARASTDAAQTLTLTG